MPTYSISAPDGNTYDIEGPEGASQEEIQNEVLRQFPQAGTPKAQATPAPAPSAAKEAVFFDETPTYNPVAEEAERVSNELTSRLADPSQSNEDIQKWMDTQKMSTGQPYQFLHMDEELARRAQPGYKPNAVGLGDFDAFLAPPPQAPTDIPEGGRGMVERFTDAVKEASQYGFGGLVARYAHDWADTGIDQLKQAVPGQSDDWYENMADFMIGQTQKNLRTEMALRQEADPNWRPDESFFDAALSPQRWVPWFVGQMAGSGGPENFAFAGGPGLRRIADTFLNRAAIGAAAGGVGEGVYQAADVLDNVEEGFDPAGFALNAATSALGEGILGGAGRAQRGAGRALDRVGATPEPSPRLLEPFKGDNRTRVGRTDRKTDVQERIAEMTSEWENAPQFEVISSAREIADPAIRAKAIQERADKDALGFLGDDGVVRLFSNRIKNQDTLNSVVFHEALGHYGLAQKFGDDLDFMLNEFDSNNVGGRFTQAVDDWIKKFPNAYSGPTQRLRAAEEVLAEMTQKGELHPQIKDKVVNKIKEWARQLGISLKYSDREIKTILGMAQDAVRKGRGRNVALNGFRFQRDEDELSAAVADADAQVRANEPVSTGRGVNSKEFKNWFGDWEKDPQSASKIVDEDGKPLRLLHGTRGATDFNEFQEGPIFLTPDPGLAGSYATVYDYGAGASYAPDGARLMPVYADIRNPLFIEGKGKSFATLDVSDAPAEVRNYLNRFNASARGTYRDIATTDQVVKAADALGYDGVVFKEIKDYGTAHPILENIPQDVVVALNTRQVKSAIGNRGTFDPNDPRLTFMREDQANVDPEEMADSFLLAKEIQAAEGYTPSIRSWDEAKENLSRIGLSRAVQKKFKTVEGLDKAIFQAEDLGARTQEKLRIAAEKYFNNEFTNGDLSDLTEAVANHNYVLGQIFNLQTELGRGLNAIKAVAISRRNIQAFREMLEDTGDPIGALGDPQVLDKFMRQLQLVLAGGNNPAGVQSLVTSLVKPYWWQYILSFRHAMMLSGLATSAKNTLDNAIMVSRELGETALSVPLYYASGKKIGASPQEAIARTYGLIKAAMDSQTYLQTARAFQKGHGNTPFSSKIEMQDARIPVVSKVSDFLHAQDTFFRSFHTNANLYALGVRDALKDGYKGKAAFEEGSHRAANPTQEMLDEAKRMSDIALLVNSPAFGNIEPIKAIKPGMGGGEQAWKFVTGMLFPFFRTSQNLIFQKLRRMGPLALLDPVTWKELRQGGPQAGIALTRIAYTSALLSYYWNSDEGEKVTGRAPSDYAKQKALEAGGYMPNSVNEGDRMVDAYALNLSFDPFDTHNQIAADIASLREALREGGNSDTVATGLAVTGRTMLSLLAGASFAENLRPYTDALGNDADDATLANMTGGLISQFIPAALRQYNYTYGDPIRRSTVGDKSFGDRVKGRIVSQIPGLSESLPANRTVYGDTQERGRTLLGINNFQEIRQDQVSKELSSVERSSPSVVVTGAPTSFTYQNIPVKLNDVEKQEWQRVQGSYLRLGMQQTIPTDEWKKATPEEKVTIVKEIRTEAYDLTKEYMLPLLARTRPELLESEEEEFDLTEPEEE